MERLKGKRILVTGAGAGIGRQICLRVSAEGARVVAMDLKEAAAQAVADEVQKAGGQCTALGGDVSRQADCQRVVEQAVKTMGGLDGLCNVAGVVDGGTLVDASEESWDRSMNINVKGMWFMCKLAVPHLLKNKTSAIMNIGSVAGPFAVKDRGVYSVSKAAVFGLTKSLAMDFIGQGLRVNSICPGTVETPSWHDRVNQAADPEQAKKDFIARQPMGRVGQPDEIAALAAYLVSDESQYMTGQSIMIDGGMTM